MFIFYASWYVSNVSIIFDCSMLLYYLFWMLMGLFLHFYIIFGTNLLTGGPVQIAVFFAYFSVSQKRNIKGVQTEWNLRESYVWNKRDPGDLEWRSRINRGGHEARGTPTPLVHPPPSWAPRCSTDLLLPPIYIHVPRERQRRPWKTISTTVTFCIREIPSWSLRRRFAGGGIDQEGLYIISKASPMSCE